VNDIYDALQARSYDRQAADTSFKHYNPKTFHVIAHRDIGHYEQVGTSQESGDLRV